MLGFITGEQAKKNGESWMSFSLSECWRYGWWVRVRLAMLVLFGYKKIDELHHDSPIGNICKIAAWVDKGRKIPGVCEAFTNAAKAFGGEDGDEADE